MYALGKLGVVNSGKLRTHVAQLIVVFSPRGGGGGVLANQFVKMRSKPSQELKQVLNNLLMMVTSFLSSNLEF